MTSEPVFDELLAFLALIPAIRLPAGARSIGRGVNEDGTWWVKFMLDTEHPFAWRVVQELAHVLNLLSNDDRLPTVFKPVSPPPYLNGGTEFLSWVIEAQSADFSPATCAQWLEGRLPRPVNDLAQWCPDDSSDDPPDVS